MTGRRRVRRAGGSQAPRRATSAGTLGDSARRALAARREQDAQVLAYWRPYSAVEYDDKPDETPFSEQLATAHVGLAEVQARQAATMRQAHAFMAAAARPLDTTSRRRALAIGEGLLRAPDGADLFDALGGVLHQLEAVEHKGEHPSRAKVEAARPANPSAMATAQQPDVDAELDRVRCAYLDATSGSRGGPWEPSQLSLPPAQARGFLRSLVNELTQLEARMADPFAPGVGDVLMATAHRVIEMLEGGGVETEMLHELADLGKALAWWEKQPAPAAAATPGRAR